LARVLLPGLVLVLVLVPARYLALRG